MRLKRRRASRSEHSTAGYSSKSILSTDQSYKSKMNNIVLCTLAVIAVAFAAPQQAQQPQPNEQIPVQILKQEADVNPEGYNFDFETSDGTSRQEKGTLKEISPGHKALEVSGSYTYAAPDGLVYTVTFIADEHGFQPQEHVSHPGQQ